MKLTIVVYDCSLVGVCTINYLLFMIFCFKYRDEHLQEYNLDILGQQLVTNMQEKHL